MTERKREEKIEKERAREIDRMRDREREGGEIY